MAGFISFHTKSKTFGLYQWSHHVIFYLMTWPSWLLLYICVLVFFLFPFHISWHRSNQLNLGQVFFIGLEKISFYPQFSMFFFVSLLIILHHILNELALEIWNHFFFFSTIKIIHFCTQTLKLHSSLAHNFTINKRQII